MGRGRRAGGRAFRRPSTTFRRTGRARATTPAGRAASRLASVGLATVRVGFSISCGAGSRAAGAAGGPVTRSSETRKGGAATTRSSGACPCRGSGAGVCGGGRTTAP